MVHDGSLNGIRLTTVNVYLKKSGILFILFVGIVLVSLPIIQFDMMFYEQPLLYLSNQQIHSVHDLIAVYLHPHILDMDSIPFYRPTGHFLIYQLLAPILGWHNTRGFLLVNFLFLALTGYMMIKVYGVLFPRHKIGGYIAVAFYVMHPALMLSRFTSLHFEFAQTFFIFCGLYCFIQFCRKNTNSLVASHTIFSHTGWLALTVLWFTIAVTFKETAILLGPILVWYFIMMEKFTCQRKVIELLALLTAVTVTLSYYIVLSWGNGFHPPTENFSALNALTSFNKFLNIAFGFPFIALESPLVKVGSLTWDIVIFPLAGRVVAWSVLVLGLLGIIQLLKTGDELYKKSVVFLLGATLICLSLPVLWIHVEPWHLVLALLFLSLLLGFGIAFFTKSHLAANTIVIGSIALVTVFMNASQIQFIQDSLNGFALTFNRNAVLHPPTLSGKLNNDSVIVEEDSGNLRNDYVYGNSTFPLVGMKSLVGKHTLGRSTFYVYPYVYGGTLFRWAYLNPNIREQTFPFIISDMEKIRQDEVIYNWLQHINNIFCLGYDSAGVWHDRTTVFKQKLLQEKERRHLVVNNYQVIQSDMKGDLLDVIRIPAPDSQLCKFHCDRNVSCKATTYVYKEVYGQLKVECYLYKEILNKRNCDGCSTFIKTQKV